MISMNFWIGCVCLLFSDSASFCVLILCTVQMLNFYTVPFHFSLVDLMGYGFALNIDKRVREYWLQFMKKYFTSRMDHTMRTVAHSD